MHISSPKSVAGPLKTRLEGEWMVQKIDMQ